MRRSVLPASLAILLVAALIGGCQSSGLRLLGVIGVTKPPIVVALVARNDATRIEETINPFPAHEPLQRALGEKVGRPIAVEPCFSFQVPAHLKDNWYSFAIISPADYARYHDPETFHVAVLPVDARGHVTHAALLVVKADSPIARPEELRGKHVAFGPAEDTHTHYAALQFLADNGLARADPALELLPLPGSLKHMANADDVTRSVLNGTSDAGFVDELAWYALPETSPGADQPARTRLKSIGQTRAYPLRLWAHSPKLDLEALSSVSDALLRMHEINPGALAPLKYSRFVAADPAIVESCLALRPSVEGEAAPASQPSASTLK